MEEIQDKINKKRKLRPSTLKTYVFNLDKLHRKMFDKPIETISFLKNTDDVMKELSSLKQSTQKTYLASIVVALDAIGGQDTALEKYRELMIKNIKDHDKEIIEQQKSPTQAKNWTTMKNLKKINSNYFNEIKRRDILNKSDKTSKDKELLQKWLVSSLYVIDNKNPPLRNDYSPMEIVKLGEYNKLTEKEKNDSNYLVIQSRNNKFFSLGEYKTSGSYGLKKIPIGKQLNTVINKYLLAVGNQKYLLTNNKNEAMSSNGLTKFIIKTFEPSGKKISANILRHIYISEYLTGPSLKDKLDLADKMGHNTNTQEKYKKT